MDPLTRYQRLLKELVTEWGTVGKSPMDISVDTLIITDHQSGNYILMSAGWWNEKRMHDIEFHARLVENKIRIEWDGTDPSITEELVRRGVPEEDLVLGWQSPVLRAMLESAAGD